jgi:hypothetical protein
VCSGTYTRVQVPHIYALIAGIILPCTHLHAPALVSKVCQLMANLPLASLQVMLDTYSHWIPSMGKQPASAIDAVLS